MTPDSRRSQTAFTSFILHLHPRKIPADTLRITLSFGLGGIAALLFAVLVFTGILQLLSYSPEISSAYTSIQTMYSGGSLAGFIRNIHYWSGNLLIVVAFLHMLRVFLTGALSHGRRLNWLIGTTLFLLTLFANFTGYLMPWDQLAYWAVTIFTSMITYIPIIGEPLTGLLRGGLEVGPETLANFFAIHIGFMPVIMILLVIWHFWLIRKAGGLIRDKNEKVETVEMIPAVPGLIQREAAVGLSILALLLLFSALFDAPLGAEANPGQSPNPTKAAWYFMGLQELLMHLHPAYAICAVPAMMISGLLVLPLIKNAVLPGGVWFGSTRGASMAGWCFLSGLAVLFVAILLDDSVSGPATPQEAWLLRGVIPLSLYTLLCGVLFFYLRLKPKFSRAEAVMGVVVFICGSVVSLTITGIWLRGPEMALAMPF